jgi:hypothetical protein
MQSSSEGNFPSDQSLSQSLQAVVCKRWESEEEAIFSPSLGYSEAEEGRRKIRAITVKRPARRRRSRGLRKEGRRNKERKKERKKARIRPR